MPTQIDCEYEVCFIDDDNNSYDFPLAEFDNKEEAKIYAQTVAARTPNVKVAVLQVERKEVFNTKQ